VSLHPEVEVLFAERRASPPGLPPVCVYKARTSRRFNHLQILHFRRPPLPHTDPSSSPSSTPDNQNPFPASDFTFTVIPKSSRLHYRSLLTVSTLCSPTVFRLQLFSPILRNTLNDCVHALLLSPCFNDPLTSTDRRSLPHLPCSSPATSHCGLML
jgi:hypothetical protein